ncbi:MAG: hypothetical protein FWD85_03950 [Microbacteriaceae bacterium]|nr:hypothetical protein [Microbacteriaceae bacterium]MCL2794442.1 hypothetical protein [Microbacteriaceae bacterium]
MHKLTKALVAATIVGGAVFAAPLAANAAPYTPAGSSTITVTETGAPGSTFTLVIISGTFVPGSTLTVTFSSTGPVPTSATAASFLAATSTVNAGTANASGGATITGTIPADATSNINVTVTDAAGNSASGVIAVNAAGTGSSNLATTGTYISLATVWGAVGLVALGGGFIVVRQMNAKRRDGQSTKA